MKILPVRRLGLALSIVLGSACSGGGGGGAPGGGGSLPSSASGTILFLDDADSVVEAEPNDTVDQAHVLGDLSAGSSITVVGHTTEAVGVDTFDAFAFEAIELVDVAVTMSFDASTGNDFDILVYDPISMTFVGQFNSADEPEVGFLTVLGPFQLLVYSFDGEGSYSLQVDATAPATGVRARDDGSPQFLGALDVERSIALSGSGAGEPARFLVASPGRAEWELAFHAELGMELVVGDATLDIERPEELLRASAGTRSTATLATAPLELVSIEVRATGPWSLIASAAEPRGAAALAPARIQRIAPLAREAHGKRALRPDQQPYGRVALPLRAGELLVRSRRDGSGIAMARTLARFSGVEVERIPGGASRVAFPLAPELEPEEAARTTIALAAALRSSTGFDYVEPNYVRQILQLPDDSFYNLQWHYPLINLPAAWDVTVGDASTIVCVIDTGETNHPDLDSRQIAGFDMIGDPSIAGDGNGRDADPTDVGDGQGVQPSSFHGTHVAGTIGAESDNGMGVAGVTWAGRLMHVRVLGIGGGTDFDISNGILYAARLANVSGSLPAERADVINMSLGGPGFSQTTQDACTSARDAGVVVVAAAGNNNSPSLFYPASYDDVLSVSAVDVNSSRAPYSNFNAMVDLAAPGGDTSADVNGDGYADGVLSTLVDDSTNPDSFIYAFYQGTSMASPHVAGVAALVLAANPLLTPAQVEGVLLSTATDLGAVGRDDLYGFGLVNAFAAVTSAAGGGSSDPILGLSALTLAFGPMEASRSVQVTNLGGDVLDVSSIIATTISGGDWLDAVAIDAGSPSASITSILVTVDRSGLADGVYAGSIAVQSDGGDATITVSLSVSATPSGEDVDVFVIAVDAFTFETLAQDVVNPSTILDFVLSDLPAGDYILAAGSDDNADNFICGPGDLYCGLYPTLDQPLVVTVGEGEDLSGLDFVVSTQFSGASAGAPVRGFRITR